MPQEPGHNLQPIGPSCFQRPVFLWSSPYLPTQQAALDEGLYYVRCVS